MNKYFTLLLLMTISLSITACNLQQAPLVPTPTLIPTPTAFDALPEQPTRTLVNQSVPTGEPLQLTVTALASPTDLPSSAVNVGITPIIGTLIPTVSTLEAVKSATIQAQAGDTVGLNYVVTMTTGSVTLTVQSVSGAVWQKTFMTSENGRIEIAIPQTGTYDVMAHTDHFDGTYQLSWD